MTDILVTIAVVALHGFALLGLLLSERRQPSATMAWILAIIFVPVVGLLCYLLFGATRVRRIVRKSAQASRRIEEIACQREGGLTACDPSDGSLEHRTAALIRLGAKVSKRQASRGNRAEVLLDGADTYSAMVEAIEQASDHIHILFYIVQPDETGRQLRDLLIRKAKQGVAVRVIVDAVGSAALPYDFFDALEAEGGSARFFQPVYRLLIRYRWRDRIDFRNHRKIVVIDGRIGFTGGINIGREYLGLDPEMGQWRDTHVQLTGPAVLSLQQVFAGDWLLTSGEFLDDLRYYPEARQETLAAGGSLVQVIDSGPDLRWSPISYILTHSISLAQDRIWLTNPYFVPGLPVRHALTTAALSGVDVRLLLPAKSDSLIVHLASRSYFKELLEAGVRIFLYERGFIHAKTTVVDDWVTSIGSANLDMRSFYLNFELTAFLFGSDMAGRMAEQFERDLEHANEVTLEELEQAGIARRLTWAGARLLSPLL